jgi:hypothetical protein
MFDVSATPSGVKREWYVLYHQYLEIKTALNTTSLEILLEYFTTALTLMTIGREGSLESNLID